jgi:hypothetical protein
MHLTDDGYLVPKLDETFDQLAALLLRDCMERYSQAPPGIKSLLENLALMQSNAGPKPPTTPTNETT